VNDPIVLRITRPYGTETEFLAAEAWTLDAKGAVLIDQPPLEPGTLVRFDIVLANGERLVRAEGRVVKAVSLTALRPGGLRVRFTRFGGNTKTLIDRVMLLKGQSSAAARSAPDASRPTAAPLAATEPPSPFASLPAPEPTSELRSSIRVATAESGFREEPGSAVGLLGASTGPSEQLQRALRDRPLRDIVAPDNRDELLARLRARKLPNAG
jgi:hypothetical protein